MADNVSSPSSTQARSPRGWAALGLAALFALTAGALLALNHAVDAEREVRESVVSTRNSIELLQRLMMTLQDAEIGQRGYLITGDPDFLEPYERARLSLAPRIEALLDVVASFDAAAVLQEIRSAADEQFAYYAEVIELRDREGPAAAADVVRQQIGKERMDLIRARVERLEDDLEARLGERLSADVASARRSETLVQVFIVTAMLMMVLLGIILFAYIRHRQDAERALRVANSVLSATMNGIPQGVSVFDAELRLIAWNPQFAALRGVDPHVLRVGLPFLSLVGHAAPVSGVEEDPHSFSRQQVLDRKSHVRELKRADGVILEVRGELRDDGNYVLTYTDITPLKRSELAYRDQATRLSAILDAAVDAIVTTNESGTIESWSKGAERLFGHSADQATGRSIDMLMTDPPPVRPEDRLSQYMTTAASRPSTRREMDVKHSDGRLMPVDVGVSQMSIGGRQLFIGIIRDIADRRAIERLKNEFVSTVSHELRTPLTSIAGAIGLLAGGATGALPPTAKRLLDIAKQNSDRLGRLINDILDLEKSASGRLNFDMQRLKLMPIVVAAVEASRGFAESRSVEIDVDAGGTDGELLTDRERLIQVLANLLSNAIKFSPAGGVVGVRIDRTKSGLQVSVTDQGPGVPHAFRSRIFQKFAQADSSDSRVKSGTGLGLSIAQTITERLGGSIDYVSEPGAGATFRVLLPEWRELQPGEIGRLSFPEGTRVLVCEDDPDITAVLVELLSRGSLNPVVVRSVRDAKATLSSQPFDVALIDLNLPDGDGLDLIAHIRREPDTLQLPVIVMTACHQEGRAELLQSLQLADWLPKPVDTRRLMNAIHAAVSDDPVQFRVLHVEDDGSLAELLAALLANEAKVTSVLSLAEATHALAKERFDLIILDINLADGSGIDLLATLGTSGDAIPPVILYSATEASREVAAQVEAALLKSGDSLEQLLATVRRLAGRKERGKRSAEEA